MEYALFGLSYLVYEYYGMTLFVMFYLSLLLLQFAVLDYLWSNHGD